MRNNISEITRIYDSIFDTKEQLCKLPNQIHDENVNISFKRNYKKLDYTLVKEEFLHFILPTIIAIIPMTISI